MWGRGNGPLPEKVSGTLGVRVPDTLAPSPSVTLINDFAAPGLGISRLSADDLLALQAGRARELQDGAFMRAFLNKGRYRELLQTMPVHVVLNPQVGLYGALVEAARLAAC